MYCPNCAQSNKSEQSFCRKCGLNLESISKSLGSQLIDGAVERVDRRLELFGNIAFSGLGIVGLAAVGGLIYTVATKFILSGQAVAFGIIISLLILFGVLAVAWVIFNEARKDKAKRPGRGNVRVAPELSAAETAKLLQTGKFEPVPSVVEDTTELLHVKSRSRKD